VKHLCTLADRGYGRDGRRRRAAGPAAALALVLLAAPAELRADRWYVHHENAERALREERWPAAVEQILQAIERKGDSGARVRSYGMKVVDYFPYLTLGIAYHQLGQHDAALEAFDTEERLGVVASSPEASERLQRYRQLATQALQEASSSAARRTREVLAESLRTAGELAARGELDAATAALDRGLSVAPEDAEAVALMASLRQRVAARDRARAQALVAAERLDTARRHLDAAEPEQAATLLRQVLAERPSDEARAMLSRAQAEIVASVAAGARHERLVEALASARRLASAGRGTDALSQLELVLALEPGHPDATALRSELLAAQEAAALQRGVAELLAAATGHLQAGRFEAALSAANRVLALERGNPRALDVVRRGYAQISRRLLAGAATGDVPPAIRFADLRQELQGRLVERVAESEFRLTGMAIDSTPVELSLRGAGGAPVELFRRAQPLGDSFVTEFRAQAQLPAGETRFELVATDGGGLSSRAEYVVLYRRPWFRSPWLYGGAAAAPVAGLLALAISRLRRRRARLRRRFNPYVAGGPVFAEELFFGREPLIQRILQIIHTNSLLLHGERRIGKTSILHHLRRRLEALDDPEYDFFPVYVDLQGTPEEKFFATLADQVFDTLGSAAEAADRRPALAREGYGHLDLSRELQALVLTLQQRTDKRVKLVLLLDEVDELNRYDPRINQKLRSLFMRRFAESLVAVVAGVHIRRDWEHETSPWYNFFEEVAVEPIGPDPALELVLRPIRGVFRVEEGVAERIVATAGGRPYLIQRRCLALVSRLHEEGRRTLTLGDVERLEQVERSEEAERLGELGQRDRGSVGTAGPPVGGGAAA
jgi:tetratricopeptide (TPR) repeat protein